MNRASPLSKVLIAMRYAVLLATVSSFVGAFFMLYVGTMKVFKAVRDYLGGIEPGAVLARLGLENVKHVTPEDLAIARVIESLDAFLIALVLLFFGYGIYFLVILGADKAKTQGAPGWLVPSSLGKLKKTLAQTILVVLFVLFTRVIWLHHLTGMTWEMLVMPAAIALLGLTLKLVDFN